MTGYDDPRDYGTPPRLPPVHIPEGAPVFVGRRPRETVLLDGQTKQAIETGRSRLTMLGIFFAGCFTLLAGRLVDISVLRQPDDARGTGTTEAVAERAAITDRNGVVLATNLTTASLYADTTKLIDIDEAVSKLIRVLPDLSRVELDAKLRSGKSFVWLKRNLTPRQEYEVNSLGLPGLAFQREERRVYPFGRLAAHVLGFVDIDSKGISGVEARFDEELRDPARAAQPLKLTLDIRVQHAVTDELSRAIETFHAIGGAAIVQDVRTGEVIAMVSMPDFDPNNPREATPENRFNRATLGTYEMGSTFKTFNTAMALDSGVAKLGSSYDATHPIKIARFTIKDDHPQARWLSVPEILIYSSNIGSAKMALDCGVDRQREFMTRMGMTRRVSIELPEAGTPQVPNPWREINTMTIAFGHGMAVTPLHLATGVAALVNGGIYFQPTLLLPDPAHPPAGERVVSSQTSASMRKLMRLVVTIGTGKKADVPGYWIGGKTGTAEKAEGGGYARKALLSSFVSAFPMTEPRYAVLVMIDEPKGTKETYGFATGGWTAAPTVGRIVERIAPLLGVMPTEGPDPATAGGVLIAKASGED
ncbi:peptidoglycan D,D-transpeptidase FtsI family protein [Zavarzinia sp.]|uniref:peptidoglycan D,D-transpeptidase FtsI family protein n=1 Tax=Zavarzinia sp. TaxID=2027920 RepID=UPI00356A9415